MMAGRLGRLAAALFVLACAPPARAELRAGEFSPPRAAPDFRLHGSDGTDVTLAKYRGKVVVLEFGFTSCPAICPVTLATLAAAHKELGERAGEMQVVFVTVDPGRDTPERLREYLGSIDPAIVGATGTEEELGAARQSYGVQSSKAADGGYVHSSSVYLIDRAGNLRAMMPFGHSAEDYVHDVGALLAEHP